MKLACLTHAGLAIAAGGAAAAAVHAAGRSAHHRQPRAGAIPAWRREEFCAPPWRQAAAVKRWRTIRSVAAAAQVHGSFSRLQPYRRNQYALGRACQSLVIRRLGCQTDLSLRGLWRRRVLRGERTAHQPEQAYVLHLRATLTDRDPAHERDCSIAAPRTACSSRRTAAGVEPMLPSAAFSPAATCLPHVSPRIEPARLPLRLRQQDRGRGRAALQSGHSRAGGASKTAESGSTAPFLQYAPIQGELSSHTRWLRQGA